MQGSSSHVGYDYKAAQYERELRKNRIHPVSQKCRYNKNGICNAPKFINRGLECRRPEVCNRYDFIKVIQ